MADALQAITKAAEGLLYPSESDAPFTPYVWQGDGEPSAATLAAAGGKGKGNKKAPPAQEQSVEQFFRELADSDDAKGFRRLEQVLRQNLTDLKVFRVGEVQVAVYVLGRDTSGHWVGLQTTSVETG